MIPTMMLFGVIFGRWWLVTLVMAAVGWPLLLLVTGVVDLGAGLAAAVVLAVANAGVGVLVHQGLRYASRRLFRPVSSGVPR